MKGGPNRNAAISIMRILQKLQQSLMTIIENKYRKTHGQDQYRAGCVASFGSHALQYLVKRLIGVRVNP